MDHRLVITYDISDDKLRVKIHRFLKNFGINSQKSVFEMLVSDKEFENIYEFISKQKTTENDSFRIYEVCKNCIRLTQRIGEGLDLNLLNYEIIE